MSRTRSLLGFLALIGALTAVASSPASAEFFGCSDRPGQVLYSYSGTPGTYTHRQYRGTPRYSTRHYSRYYAARPHRRHATYYGGTHYWNGR